MFIKKKIKLFIKGTNKLRAAIAVLISLLFGLLTGCGSDEVFAADPPIVTNDEFAQPMSEGFISGDETSGDTLRISEVMSSNKTVLYSADAGFPDWIEILNYGENSVSTHDIYITDNEKKPEKYALPDITVLPGERILLLCCDAPKDCGNDLYTGFKLDKKGCSIVLSKCGKVLDRVSVPELGADQSFIPEDNRITREATPGYSNDFNGYTDFLSFQASSGSLQINEVSVYNNSYHHLPGCDPDWIELKNCSNGEINLNEFYIGDGTSAEDLRRLPDYVLSPGDLYVIYLVGSEHPSLLSSNCFDLSLNSAEEQIYLFKQDGSLVDCIGVYDAPLYGTVGRMNSENGIFLFKNGSPERDNTNGFRYRCEVPYPSTSPGCYDNVQQIAVSLFGEGNIYYTINGETPTLSSPIYNEPLVIDKTTVIRAFCSSENKLDSSIICLTYFINENNSLPVVSIVSDGFNSMYSRSKRGVPCDANISLFDSDSYFTRDCKLELHGTSASSYPGKKSYKVTFSDRYGGALNYDVFGDGENTRFHSLLLRGTLISAQEIYLYRDSLASIIANQVYPKDINPLTLKNKYCVLYINGNYWGLYALREAYSSAYCSSHLGGKEEDYLIARPGFLKESESDIREMIYGIIESDMSDHETYSRFSEQIDMRSLALWYCFESYFNNQDSGNIRYTRNITDGGKWYVMLYDFDLAMMSKNAQWERIISKSTTSVAPLLRSLLKSPEFRDLLLSSARELYDGGLSDKLVRDTFEKLVDEVSDDMPRNLEKWKISKLSYEQRLDSFMEFFADGRIKMWINKLQKLLNESDEKMHLLFPEFY